jgi:hypothetical protein
MEDVQPRRFGGKPSIADYEDWYGTMLVKVANNVMSPVAPESPLTNKRLYEVIQAYVTHYDDTEELMRRRGMERRAAALQKALEVAADKDDVAPETIRKEYRELYDDTPRSSFLEDLETIRTHLTQNE